MMRRSGKREERYPIALAMASWSQTHSQTKAAPAPPPSPGTRPKTHFTRAASRSSGFEYKSHERERTVRDDKGEIGEKSSGLISGERNRQKRPRYVVKLFLKFTTSGSGS
jgi:hypothetical protein